MSSTRLFLLLFCTWEFFLTFLPLESLLLLSTRALQLS